MKLRGVTSRDLTDAMAWARATCHAALGPVAGEALVRRLPALPVLWAWAVLCARAKTTSA